MVEFSKKCGDIPFPLHLDAEIKRSIDMGESPDYNRYVLFTVSQINNQLEDVRHLLRKIVDGTNRP